jgi:hypothetical protein
VGAYGDIVIRENGRTSISRPLHRWKPQIKVKSIGSSGIYPFIKYDITMTLHARSTIGLYLPEVLTRDCFRDSIWNDPPPAQFAALWDVTASNIAWKVEGEGSDGDYYYKYEGSGLKPLIETYPPEPEDGILTDESGASVTLKVRAFVPFTWTVKDLANGSVRTLETVLPILVKKDNIAISDDWGVFPASFQSDVVLGGGMAQIDWNAFSAEPPFDKDKEPR